MKMVLFQLRQLEMPEEYHRSLAVENDDNGGNIFSMAKQREDFRLATGEALFRWKG